MGVGRHLLDLTKRMAQIREFWRIERISLNCFNFTADSGDLLLF